MSRDWFTIERIDQDTFAISEYQHWEETHCYLLLGHQKALLIDTGLGVSNIGEVVSRLTSLPIEVATTHVHWDHIGGHSYFSFISVHEYEEKWLWGHFPLPLSVVKANLQHKPCTWPADFDIEAYQIYQGRPNRILRDGDVIQLGHRSVHIIHTPGHSPGHICFYEEEKGYLYAGDLIYAGCLDAFYPTTDPVQFMYSIQKVKKIGPQKIWPGHHRLDIPELLLDKIDRGFQKLAKAGALSHGQGIFDFEGFQIHL